MKGGFALVHRVIHVYPTACKSPCSGNMVDAVHAKAETKVSGKE